MQEPRRQSAQSVEEALRNAAHHARNAAAEIVAAGRSLLDAVALVASRTAAADSPTLASVARLLDELEAHIASPTRGASAAEPILRALSEALDAEVARWQKRAETDPDARAVLRAFLGLREVLWELGVRPGSPRNMDPAQDPQYAPPQRKRNSGVTSPTPEVTHTETDRRESRPRVQRLRVQG